MELITFKKTGLKHILKNKTVDELNEVLKDYAIYNKCHNVNDIVFEHNGTIYLNYNIDEPTYNKIDIEELEDFINDIVDNIEYMETIDFIIEYIL